LIQVITRQPVDKFEADVKVGGGTDNQEIILGVLNIPFDETLAGRFALQHRAQDGYVHNSFDGKDWNDKNADTGRATLLWSPTENFTANVGLDFQRVREKPSLATCRFLGPENGAAAGGLEFFAWVFGTYDAIRTSCINQSAYKSYEDDPDNRSDIDQWGSTLTLNWSIEGIGDITSITAYRNMEEINGSWGYISDSPIGDVLEIQQPSNKNNNFDQVSQELRLHSTSFNDKLDWQTGVYLFEEHNEQYFAVPLFRKSVAPDCAVVPQFCFPTPSGATLGQIAQGLQIFASNDLDYDAHNKSQAIYGEAVYHITDRLNLTAGIRYTEDERKLHLVQTLLGGVPDPGYRCPDGSVPVNSTCKRKTGTLDETTPRVILSYNLTDDVLVYGSWSKGYSSGGINQTPRLEDYLPETSKNWELGFKSNLFDRRVQFNMTTFYNTYENQQESVGRIIDNQPVVAILNAQEATLWGVEGELMVVPAEGWMITAVGGYVHGEYDKFTVNDTIIGPPPDLTETVVVRDLSDVKVIRGPPYTYSVSLAKTFNFRDGSSLTGQTGWSYFARRFDDLQAAPFTRQGRRLGLGNEPARQTIHDVPRWHAHRQHPTGVLGTTAHGRSGAHVFVR
jgi:iron complex outermembrane receptor protein